MINKKEFDLLLQEIYQIENKIIETKILNQFDKATEYEQNLDLIRKKATKIVLDKENKSSNFDSLSLEVFSELILLDCNISYYLLKANNIIESATDSKLDLKAIETIKELWNTLENDIQVWNKSNHNPIEEMEYNKHIGKITLDIILFQIQAEGILDYSKALKFCKKEFLINAIKETLFEGIKNEFHDNIRKRRIIELAKNICDKDLLDYKLWEQILIVKNVRSRDDHIEIIGNFKELDNKKSHSKEISDTIEDQNIDIYYEENLLKSIKRFFSNISESFNQRQMNHNWATNKGPAFKSEFEDGSIKYSKENIDKNTIENVKKLIVATNGVAKYNFEKNSKWKKLVELEFLENKNTSDISLSPDKTYNCIGNDSFVDATNLQKISFGKIEMIGERAFKNCTNLSNITFSTNLINIGEDAFLNCTNLTKVRFLAPLKLYILDRPQNIINCFKGSNLEEIVFPSIECAFNFAITDCPHLKQILISSISNISIPFKTCKYRFGRQEGIVTFVTENALNLWKKKIHTIRFFELTDEEKEKYKNNQ